MQTEIICKNCGLISKWDTSCMKAEFTSYDQNSVGIEYVKEIPEIYRRKYRGCSCIVNSIARDYSGICPSCGKRATIHYHNVDCALIYKETPELRNLSYDEIADKWAKLIYETETFYLYIHENCL